ncbi:MAG: hypothetical protein CVU50_05205 [Candidatus Cloacimonetes bacterium HGW-Cloacimonetes-3]|jgi:hypothetical protein|nr:MAG: hypothetical protein CVU50_05205 [Candidatus Cloacimonetes bacterium HGW-Cloacimonetes-3]
MIPQNAPIQQTQFAVLQSSIALNVNKKTKQVSLAAIPLEIEYDIYFNDEIGPYAFRIVMTIKGNAKKTVPGYVFTLKVGSEYKLSEDLAIDGDDYKMYVSNTGVACLINEARVYLQSLSAFFPFGAYIMPMVDMRDLMSQRSDEAKVADIQG